jgi:hypothetical protein
MMTAARFVKQVGPGIAGFTILLAGFAACRQGSAPGPGRSAQGTEALGPARNRNRDDTEIRRLLDGFYALQRQRHYSGIPDAPALPPYRPFLSHALFTLLRQAQLAEGRYNTAKSPSDGPCELDGDLFTSLFEGSTSQVASTPRIDHDRAECEVRFAFREHPEAKPFEWTDVLIVSKEQGHWVIDDVHYGGSWGLANRGLLSKGLEAHIREVEGITPTR